jgi:phosphoribosylanthranilate isomerase
MKIKVCGLNNYENITNVIIAGADYVGFIFHKGSPRYFNGALSFDEVRKIKTKKVGIFVNEDLYSVLDKVAHYDLDLVQLHGSELPEYCSELRKYVKTIKAFGIDGNFDFDVINEYAASVDYFLFDTFTAMHGGSGKNFDHNLLQKYGSDVPFFLSGGISLESINNIRQLNFKQLIGLDLNSKFEISPGIKEASKIKQFIKRLNENN